MGIAHAVSQGGTCPRAQVGAVVVKDDRVIGLGYNGAPRGEEHCGCILERRRGRDHCIKAVHAEVNAVLNGYGDMRGATLYCTHESCYDCLRLLLNAGIKRLVFNGGSYQDDERQKALLLKFETLEYRTELRDYARPMIKKLGHHISGYQAHNL